MSARAFVVVGGAAALALVGVVALRRGATASAPVGPAPAPEPRNDAADKLERPPEFPPVRSQDELVAKWIEVLAAGDESDVAWATGRLRLADDVGRRAVRAAGTAAVADNPALVEQALEFVLTAPRDEDAAFARAALATADGEAVTRAIRLLGEAPGPDRDGAARAVGAAARAGDVKTRVEGVRALAKIGGEAAADEAVALLAAAAADEAASLCAAAAGFKSPKVRARLAEDFAKAEDPRTKVAAADALVAQGDASPTAWLESVVASPPAGAADVADAALAALAAQRHAGALARIGAAAADALEDPQRRIRMIGLLARYPAADARPFLEAASADVPGVADPVRIEAHEALARADAPGAVARLLDFVRRGDRRAATLGALVFGRLKSAGAAPALVEASRRGDLDEETRTMCLRAVVLSGAAEHAETVVRAMAGDRVPYGARLSSSQNVASQFGGSTREFRKAAGTALVRSLADEFGPLEGAGLVQALDSSALCCGPEAAPVVARRLAHADVPVRLAAAEALGFVADAASERELRAAWWRAADPALRARVAVAMARAHWRFGAAPR